MIRKSGRNTDGTFGPGNSGKPEGTRHKATEAARALLDGEAEAPTRQAVQQALGGDTIALRLCLERIVPVRKDTTVKLVLPKMKCAADAAKAAQVVLVSVSNSEMTPLEGAGVMNLIESYRQNVLTDELEQRILVLEAVKNEGS